MKKLINFFVIILAMFMFCDIYPEYLATRRPGRISKEEKRRRRERMYFLQDENVRRGDIYTDEEDAFRAIKRRAKAELLREKIEDKREELEAKRAWLEGLRRERDRETPIRRRAAEKEAEDIADVEDVLEDIFEKFYLDEKQPLRFWLKYLGDDFMIYKTLEEKNLFSSLAWMLYRRENIQDLQDFFSHGIIPFYRDKGRRIIDDKAIEKDLEYIPKNIARVLREK